MNFNIPEATLKLIRALTTVHSVVIVQSDSVTIQGDSTITIPVKTSIEALRSYTGREFKAQIILEASTSFETSYLTEIEPMSDLLCLASTTSETIISILDCALPFIDTNSSRYYLEGLHINEKHLVATNGQSMSIKPNSYLPMTDSVIIPTSTLTQLLRLLKQYKNTTVKVEINKEYHKFTIKDDSDQLLVELFGGNIDGTFPEYSRVIPKESTKHGQITIPVTALNNIKPNANTKIRLSKGKLTIDAGYTLPVEYLSNLDRIITASGLYLANFAKLSKKHYTLSMFEDGGPMVITVDNPAHSETIFLLMPMRN